MYSLAFSSGGGALDVEALGAVRDVDAEDALGRAVDVPDVESLAAVSRERRNA